MKKPFLLLLLPLILFATGLSHAQEKAQWMEPYLPPSLGFINPHELIIGSLKKDANAEAIGMANSCLAKEPSNAACYFFRAWARGATGLYPACVNDVDQTLKLSSGAASDPQVYYIRSMCNHADSQFDAALRDAGKVIALAPDNPTGYDVRANIYLSMKQYDRAIADRTKILGLQPTYENYLDRAAAYFEAQKYDLALADASKSISMRPTYRGYLIRAYAYGYEGELKKAAADANYLAINFPDKEGTTQNLIEGIIKEDPAIADVWLAKAQLSKNQKKFTQAVAEYTKAAEIDPNGISAYFSRGLVYGETKEFAKAIADYTKVIQINPKTMFAFYNRGNAYYDTNQMDKAVEDYTAYIALAPRDEDGYNNRGRSFMKLGKTELALADFNKALDIRVDAVSFNNRADALLKLNRRDEAIDDYRSALKDDEKNAHAAKALKDLGVSQKALFKSLNKTIWAVESDTLGFCKFTFDDDGTVDFYNDKDKSYNAYGTFTQNGNKFTLKFTSYEIGYNGPKKNEEMVMEGEYYLNAAEEHMLKIVSVVPSKNAKGRIINGLELPNTNEGDN